VYEQLAQSCYVVVLLPKFEATNLRRFHCATHFQ